MLSETYRFIAFSTVTLSMADVLNCTGEDGCSSYLGQLHGDEAAVACGSIEGYWRYSVLQDSIWCYGDQLIMETKRKGEKELNSRLLAPHLLSLTFPMILLQLRIWESDASSARRLMTLRLPSPWLWVLQLLLTVSLLKATARVVVGGWARGKGRGSLWFHTAHLLSGQEVRWRGSFWVAWYDL